MRKGSFISLFIILCITALSACGQAGNTKMERNMPFEKTSSRVAALTNSKASNTPKATTKDAATSESAPTIKITSTTQKCVYATTHKADTTYQETSQIIKTYGIGQTWTVPGQWSFTIKGVRETDYRLSSSSHSPAAVYIVDYQFTNLGYAGAYGGLYFDITNQIVDCKNFMGYQYTTEKGFYPQHAAVGATSKGQAYIGVDHSGPFKLTILNFDSNGVNHTAIFEIKV